MIDDFIEPHQREPLPCESCGHLTKEIAFCEHCGAPLFDDDLEEWGDELE